MSQEEDLIKTYHILDVIKFKLDEILINGLESISNKFISELRELQIKSEAMNLSTLANLLGTFLDKVEQLGQKPIPIELKKDISVEILQIIAVTRLFERVMNIESVKKILKYEE